MSAKRKRSPRAREEQGASSLERRARDEERRWRAGLEKKTRVALFIAEQAPREQVRAETKHRIEQNENDHAARQKLDRIRRKDAARRANTPRKGKLPRDARDHSLVRSRADSGYTLAQGSAGGIPKVISARSRSRSEMTRDFVELALGAKALGPDGWMDVAIAVLESLRDRELTRQRHAATHQRRSARPPLGADVLDVVRFHCQGLPEPIVLPSTVTVKHLQSAYDAMFRRGRPIQRKGLIRLLTV